MGLRIEGNTSGNNAEVNSNNELKVSLTSSATGNGMGGIRFFSENDPGAITGQAILVSPETDVDFRLRVGHDTLLDTEVFNYTAQNTGKYYYNNTTLAFSWSAAGLTTNSANITTTTTGGGISTYAYFPLYYTAPTYVDMFGGFTAQPTANTIIDFGLFLRNTTNPFNPTDGVFFRLTSAGLFGVVNSNGSEVTTSVFSFSYTNSHKYQFTIIVSNQQAQFWVDNVLYGSIDTPQGLASPFLSQSVPFSVRHAIVGGAAGSALSFALNTYSVTLGGIKVDDSLGTITNRILGSHQGLSGGTMGSLALYANQTFPTSSAGSNATANITGLGGRGAINAVAGLNTNEFMMTSYQVPTGSATVQGRRLRINGVKISCANLGAAVATTATTIGLSLAWGGTSVALSATEAATTKAHRREALGIQYWNVGAPIGATPQNGDTYMFFQNPIYVNPGESVATAMQFLVGTATASQSIWFHVTFDYGWE